MQGIVYTLDAIAATALPNLAQDGPNGRSSPRPVFDIFFFGALLATTTRWRRSVCPARLFD